MIINHNLAALNTINKLTKNNKSNTNAIEKLASGLRINKAADDAAGLAISEKMRAQIRGTEQANKNIQDGISLIQSADAALGQIQNPNLQRIRELAIQAANDTLTAEDRGAIQTEIDQIKLGIDDIANNTEFNSIKILRPPIIETPPVTVPGKSDIIFIIDNTGSMGSPIANVKNNIESFVNKMKDEGVDVRLGLVTYGDISPSENGEWVEKKDFVTDVEVFKTYIGSVPAIGGGDTEESGLEGIADPTNGALSFSFREDATKQFILVTDAPVHDNATDGDGGDGQSSYDIDDVANLLKTNNIKLHVVSSTASGIATQLDRLTTPTGGTYMDIYGDFSSQLSSLASSIIVDSGNKEELENMPPITLQVGANSGDSFLIELFDARTDKLKIATLSINPADKAQEAITLIDEAIKMISSQRGKLGAYQNALEHIQNNISNYGINITAAESGIRDSDMAKEVMAQAKNSILSQSAQAMLIQANQQPQAVLQLLR
ncbi:flagellin [Bacillus marasmi]|uniref:flagellin n=1 Tax=Bacillus marasmi TaxID=1926279 RepID=UPI0011C7EEDC|nr:flagellin [Bacillus marasmi]